MDIRLQVTDKPREVVCGVLAEMPLVTIAWRALHSEHQRRADERKCTETEVKQVLEALMNAAEEIHRLRYIALALLPVLQETGIHVNVQQLLAIASRMEKTLTDVDIAIVAPNGEPYTAELMELLDNIAQRPEAEVLDPHVAEVITPAVIYRGAVLRRGKAIIAVPKERKEVAQANTNG